MFKICVVLLLFCVFVNSTRVSLRSTDSSSCTIPKLKNGRARLRQRGRLVRFFCLPNFTLVGNRYVSCHLGTWDGEFPICVKSGCDVRDLKNGIQWRLHDDAWIVSFCFSGYELRGSSVIYCDGQQWNGTFPTCVDTKTQPPLSCDFEKDLCGWTDDEYHDFDWRRLNKRTPSFFLRTGPSFDHTLGEGKSGHYMYIESTSRKENETARLISPIYSAALSENGCFSFYYHMYGRTIGGLKVYQKPESIGIFNFLTLIETEKKKYTLFEKWGNQGDIWLREVSKLNNFNDSFQIVIEGIRGSSFTSDIAIDDVSILQGDACDVLITTTPLPPPEETCAGRCFIDTNLNDAKSAATPSPGDQCGCSAVCFAYGNCCPDYFELCLFSDAAGPSTDVNNDNGTAHELPQTQKLVAANTTVAESTTTSVSTTPKASVSKMTSPKTKSTSLPTTTLITTSTTTTEHVTTKTTVATTSEPTTVKKIPMTTEPTVKTTMKTVKTTTKLPVSSTIQLPVTTKVSSTIKTTKVTAKVETTTSAQYSDKKKHEKVLSIENKKTSSSSNPGVNATALTVSLVLICVCALFALLVWRYRGARGHIMVSRLRGRITSDSEVRYLSAETDD